MKRNLPYHEHDQVPNVAYNLMAGGSRLKHIVARRNDDVYLDAHGADHIPNPSTTGDFCRRFGEADMLTLMEEFNETRLRAWAEQSDAFFDEAAIIDDITHTPTGELRKQGVDIAYNSVWGDHPLVVSLTNTAWQLC